MHTHIAYSAVVGNKITVTVQPFEAHDHEISARRTASLPGTCRGVDVHGDQWRKGKQNESWRKAGACVRHGGSVQSRCAPRRVEAEA